MFSVSTFVHTICSTEDWENNGGEGCRVRNKEKKGEIGDLGKECICYFSNKEISTTDPTTLLSV